MWLLIALGIGIVALAVVYEVLERRNRGSGTRGAPVEGPDQMRNRIEMEAEVRHSFRSGYKKPRP